MNFENLSAKSIGKKIALNASLLGALLPKTVADTKPESTAIKTTETKQEISISETNELRAAAEEKTYYPTNSEIVKNDSLVSPQDSVTNPIVAPGNFRIAPESTNSTNTTEKVCDATSCSIGEHPEVTSEMPMGNQIELGKK
ncbi:MAG: hypothetical protein NT165_03990 [Candidatus Falkowbacteria bacterium]|nr:hypothetical protein [Candidatus Falkowbacteria bacterium]